jgi:hypothetical protein
VIYQDTAIIVTVFVPTLPSPQACPTSRPIAYVVHLDEPLGDRALLNGGPWPPVEIQAAGSPGASPQ